MSEEIIRANPRHQRLALLILALVGALAVWGVLRLESDLDEARALSVKSVREAAVKTQDIAFTYFRLLGAGLGLFGLYLTVTGARIASSGRFPPPRALVVRDTKLVRGAGAHVRAAVAIVAGLAFVAASVYVPGWAERQLEHVLSGAMQTPDAPPESYLPYVE